ncbi:ABC transporter ATP-binding protein [Cryptosporangium phraense]|uniref:ABC transporter ATP-binding protein n=1 Tax=Cryptosporangium phraense TaxID=2593070 RepID=A0A545AW24_9ACTN|nr:ABC transporter ATP-binding protein [Cryptosporangium phraense]
MTKSFPAADGRDATPVLRGISLSIRPGEFVSIVGPSGSGKSTLLYCLSGLEPITSGEVVLAGTPVSSLRRTALARLRRDHVGFVFQSYNLIPSLSAWDNVALPGRLAGRRISDDEVDAALARVGLAERARHKPSALSGGQQQRVAVARVLAARPDIVFADEPTGALDTAAGEQVLGLLREAADGDRSVVLVTHDLQAAARGDRVLVLRDGVIHRELVKPSAEQVFEAVTCSA